MESEVFNKYYFRLINFHLLVSQYYWLPEGPASVVVTNDIVYYSNDYTITDNPTTYTASTLH